MCVCGKERVRKILLPSSVELTMRSKCVCCMEICRHFQIFVFLVQYHVLSIRYVDMMLSNEVSFFHI